MIIVAGLGNPEKKYELTRHNVGFVALDLLAHELGATFAKAAHRASVAEARLGGQKILLMKPSTYMNLSGESLRDAVAFYKLEAAASLIVIYDDIDLPVGEIRIRMSGSAGTHNGMRSILYHLQTEDFARIRVGIGRPPRGHDLANYVLGKPLPDEQAPLSEAIRHAVDAAKSMLGAPSLGAGAEAAQQKYNHAGTGPKPAISPSCQD